MRTRFWRVATLWNLASSLFAWGCSEDSKPAQGVTPSTMQPAASGAPPSAIPQGGSHAGHPAGGEGHQASAFAGNGAAHGGAPGAGAGASGMMGRAGMPAAGAAPMAGSMAGAAGGGTTTPMMNDTWPKLAPEMIGEPMRLGNNYALAEGPLWDHCGKQMLFTDVDNKIIHKIAADGTIGAYRTDTNYVNGIAFDMQGRLLMAEMGGRSGGRITRVEKDGTIKVLADKDPGGGALNTSDDLIVRSDGTIFFSDPVIPHGNSTAVSLTAKPLYRLTKDEPGMVIEEDQLQMPNGVDFSPDEKILYVSAFLGGQVFKYNVGADGKLSGRQVFISGVTNPDSMCLDAAGNLYVGASQGLIVTAPDGTRIKFIRMTTNNGVTNCNFGGEDGKTLYITAWASLWKIDNMPIPGLDWTVHKRIACN